MMVCEELSVVSSFFLFMLVCGLDVTSRSVGGLTAMTWK